VSALDPGAVPLLVDLQQATDDPRWGAAPAPPSPTNLEAE
jgi:hypothetical protein